MSKDIRVRIAPSPTGFLHIGTARSALFNFLFARHNNGTFIIRVEDTDKERSKKEYEEEILDSLKWLGITSDEFYRQSELNKRHEEVLRKLVDDGFAYLSKEPAKEGSGEVEVIRFKNPNKTITFSDIIRGDITFDTADLKDFVIAKSFTEPLYHLAVVVDDFDMKISHIIRGEDHISNTPRQILLQEAIGAPRPLYAHIPLILAPDKSKLSKRKIGQGASINHYKKEGYIPEAMVNFLAFLGWNPKDEREIMSKEEIIQNFDLEKVQRSGAVFNVEKLDWLNKEYLRNAPDVEDQITSTLEKIDEKFSPIAKRVFPTILERISKIGDIQKLSDEGELEYFYKDPTYNKESLVWKKSTPEKTVEHLKNIYSFLENVNENDFSNVESIKSLIWDYAEKEGRGDVLWPIRFCLSGKDKSPDPFTLLYILGKKESLSRIKKAISLF